MPIASKRLVLLTGAGFTKNFNGFLAREMWSKIFNHAQISRQERIKNLLSMDYDFESVYSKVVHGIDSDGNTSLPTPAFTEEEKQVLQSVMEQVYKQLDDSIRTWQMNDDNPTSLDTYKLGELLNLFVGTPSERGFFFTLNQDIFMERRNNFMSPGAPRFPQEFTTLSQREFLPTYSVTLPGENAADLAEKEIIQNTNTLHYIKLHGSFGWRSAHGGSQMIIGVNKEQEINNEPLLKYYLELFKAVLKEGNKKLLVIGYGFHDKHVNKIIWDAAKNHGLKLYILTTTAPDKFEAGNFIIDSYRLWPAISGYFPYSLREIFPPDQSGSVHLNEIRAKLLEA